MKREPREFFSDHQRADYLENPEYDLGCEWVIRNLPRVRALVPDTKIDSDGFVVEGENRSRLLALRQIGARQDTRMGNLSGPMVGFIDVAIIEQSTRETKFSIEGNGIKWVVTVFVRPTIPHIESFLREIEKCRHGYVIDNRASVVHAYQDHLVSPKDLSVVVVTKNKEHGDVITSQGFIPFSCPEAFIRPASSAR